LLRQKNCLLSLKFLLSGSFDAQLTHYLCGAAFSLLITGFRLLASEFRLLFSVRLLPAPQFWILNPEFWIWNHYPWTLLLPCRLQPPLSPPASLKTLRTQRVAGEYGFPLFVKKAEAFYVSPSQRNIKLSSLRPLCLCGDFFRFAHSLPPNSLQPFKILHRG
jgi:hypothetical protein